MGTFFCEITELLLKLHFWFKSNISELELKDSQIHESTSSGSQENIKLSQVVFMPAE